MDRLSKRQEEVLREFWETAGRYHQGDLLWDYDSFEEWADAVLKIEVTLHPGGRATVSNPSPSWPPRARFRVDIFWIYDRAERLFSPTEVRIVGEPDANVDAARMFGYNAEAYFGRLFVELMAEAGDEFAKAVPRKRPRPGQPLDADFYRHLLGIHRQLVREGHPAPGKGLAERMHENPATVRTWLKRARDMEKS